MDFRVNFCPRRASTSTQELNVEREKWNLAQHYLFNAEEHLRAFDTEEAKSLCEKALEVIPDFYPAKELRKRIERGLISEYQNDELNANIAMYTECPEDENLHKQDRVFQECADQSRLPYTARAPNSTSNLNTGLLLTSSPAPAPKKLVGILKKPGKGKEVRIVEPQDEDEPKLPTLVTSESSSQYNRRRLRRELRLKSLLLEGHYHLIPAREVFVNLDRWARSLSRDGYDCPMENCSMTFYNRLTCIGHFLNAHFPVDPDGREIRPFVCKTCKESYRELFSLIHHGEARHPKCRWLDPLKEAVRSNSTS